MNFNKTLLNLRNSYLKLPKLSIYKYAGSNSALYTKELSFKYCRVLPKQTSICFYSSAVNEEQMKTKNSASVITVPTLHFEDAPFDEPVSHNKLCDDLQICDSVEEQMSSLTSTLALSPDDVQLRINFCKTIESLFRPFFGKIKIQMFGSSVNGFGFKGCDIDMSFETFAEQKEEISYLEIPDVPLVSEVMCGKVSPLEISLLPAKEQLLFIHTVLLEFYKDSEEPIVFINAYVPLIRFYHDKYNLKCDLTCRNRVAFSNTKLLYLFGKLDERVIPLMMTLRYWAKHVELIGKGLMFNTYTISLMIIHFLQTRNPPILPSAEHILSLTDSLQIEDMSDKSFLTIRKFIPPSENTQTLSELLREFFFYYLYFDFTRVICPLIGGSVPREKFFSEKANRKFRMNSICVQDPMLTTHNVAELVDYKHCRNLFTELITSCRIFQSSTVLSPSSSKWGILALLDKPDKFQHNNQIWKKSVSLSIPLITKQVFGDNVKKNIELFTAETLLQLLKHVLLFEYRTLETPELLKMLSNHDKEIKKQLKLTETSNQRNSEIMENLQKHKKHYKYQILNVQRFSDALMLEDFQKFNLNNELVLCAECQVDKNTWLGRTHVSLESLPVNVSNNVVEKERYISINAAKQNAANAMDEKLKPFTFFYECYISSESPKSSLLINFRPYQKTSFNPVLGIFLKEYLPEIIKNLNED